MESLQEIDPQVLHHDRVNLILAKFPRIGGEQLADIVRRTCITAVDALGIEPELLLQDASLTDDLGADSLDRQELRVELEIEHNIDIPDEYYDEVNTVADLIECVVKTILEMPADG